MSRALASVLLALVLAAAAPAAARDVVAPLGAAEPTPIGDNGTEYYDVGRKPLRLDVVGPGTLSGYTRMALAGPDAEAVAGTLTIAGVVEASLSIEFTFTPSSSSRWNDNRPGVPSGGRKFSVEVPPGAHRLELTASPAMLAVLYWDGPPLPGAEGDDEDEDGGDAGPSWRLLGNASLDVIYNSNILTASPDDVDAFESGSYPYKFGHETTDDLVVAGSLQLEARRDLVSLGETRFRGRVKRWTYTHNAIKTNTDFDFFLRQYFGRRQSLELYLHTAPEQYIRHLSDRPPYVDPDTPLVWEEFRFQRNIWNLTWRQRLSRSLSGMLIYERNYRYYNQPFMENDIEAWEVRWGLGWDISRTFSVDVGYSYEDGNGRAVDEVGETPATSDNSDPSYERDLYRAELQIRWRALRQVVERIDLTFLYMDYYYTTDRLLVDDPYHVGRRDMYTKWSFELRRRLSRSVTAVLATRRTERVVESPWEGDLATDKAFVQWLYWIDLTYRF
jgi:opacity protein-like surface antigen